MGQDMAMVLEDTVVMVGQDMAMVLEDTVVMGIVLVLVLVEC